MSRGGILTLMDKNQQKVCELADQASHPQLASRLEARMKWDDDAGDSYDGGDYGTEGQGDCTGPY